MTYHDPDDWMDLADSELRAKLEQKGIHPEIAANIVKMRDNAEEIEELEEFMERWFE